MEDKLCRDTNNSFLLCGTIAGTELNINSNAGIEPNKAIKINNVKASFSRNTAGTFTTPKISGFVNITLKGGTNPSGDTPDTQATQSTVTGTNIDMTVDAGKTNTQIYNSNGGTLTVNLGKRGYYTVIKEYPQGQAPEECIRISGDMHVDIWEYGCPVYGEDGSISITPQ